jgi:hypothetical protein
MMSFQRILIISTKIIGRLGKKELLMAKRKRAPANDF